MVGDIFIYKPKDKEDALFSGHLQGPQHQYLLFAIQGHCPRLLGLMHGHSYGLDVVEWSLCVDVLSPR